MKTSLRECKYGTTGRGLVNIHSEGKKGSKDISFFYTLEWSLAKTLVVPRAIVLRQGILIFTLFSLIYSPDE